MPHFNPPHIAVALLIALLLAPLVACDHPGVSSEPWLFSHEQAHYEVLFSSDWVAESPDEINPFADLAASQEDRKFFLVITQELPDYPSPTLRDLEDLALGNLRESVDTLDIQRRGPLSLDGVSGSTIFATGELDDDEISYITSYAIYEGMGYQLIAFSEPEHQQALFDEVDILLSDWQFLPVEADE